jgi:hypothetical protein
LFWLTTSYWIAENDNRISKELPPALACGRRRVFPMPHTERRPDYFTIVLSADFKNRGNGGSGLAQG